MSDARYCSGMGVDLLGFNLNQDDTEAVSPELFLEITNWVSGVQFVGEFDTLAVDNIKLIQQAIPLDFIEISDLNNVEQVGILGKPIIFRLELITESDVRKLASTFSYLDELVDYVVITSKNPSLFSELNEFVSFYLGRIKLIKGFDVSVEMAKSLNGYSGIQLIGTDEKEPGLKDYGEVMDILEELEIN